MKRFLHGEDHVHPQPLALGLGQLVAVEVAADALVPVVVAVHELDVGVVQVVRDADPLIPQLVVCPDLIHGPDVTAAAGLHGVQMQLVFIHRGLLK